MKWSSIKTFEDIKLEKSSNNPLGIIKITINRPKLRNAFRPKTVFELKEAFNYAKEDNDCGVVILTGEGSKAFCSGGDQKVRGDAGYVGDDGVPRLNILEVQRQIRNLPKPVIAMVAGYAVGGGHVLHMICDLTIASSNAQFGQTGPIVGSFDGGWGSSYMARIIGQKRAREMWFLCRFYDAQTALEWGLVNKVVEYEDLENETIQWCEEILEKSPNIDILWIATPTNFKYFLVEEALNNNLNVIIEKPWLHDEKKTKKIIQISKKKNYKSGFILSFFN